MIQKLGMIKFERGRSCVHFCYCYNQIQFDLVVKLVTDSAIGCRSCDPVVVAAAAVGDGLAAPPAAVAACPLAYQASAALQVPCPSPALVGMDSVACLEGKG